MNPSDENLTLNSLIIVPVPVEILTIVISEVAYRIYRNSIQFDLAILLKNISNVPVSANVLHSDTVTSTVLLNCLT